MPSARIYYSLRSPYSRLGLHIAQRNKLSAQLIPFTGPPEGAPFHNPTENALKMRYYQLDAPRMTMRMGLPIQMPNPFEVSFDAANKAFVAADRAGLGLAFAVAASDARWGRGEDVSELGVLKSCAEQIGLDPESVSAAQEDSSVSDVLKAHRELIKKDGVFGVPFAVYGDAKYWGHDRFDLLVEDVQNAPAKG